MALWYADMPCPLWPYNADMPCPSWPYGYAVMPCPAWPYETLLCPVRCGPMRRCYALSAMALWYAVMPCPLWPCGTLICPVRYGLWYAAIPCPLWPYGARARAPALAPSSASPKSHVTIAVAHVAALSASSSSEPAWGERGCETAGREAQCTRQKRAAEAGGRCQERCGKRKRKEEEGGSRGRR
eukprot:3941426-Rhodomonas_salina.1